MSVDQTATRYVYQPVWDVRRQAILMYRCLPARQDETGEIITGHRVLGPGADSAERLSFDVAVLHRISKVLQALAEKRRRLLLSCSVHFDTLARPHSRRAYTEHCYAIPERLRSEISFEIAGVPRDIPQTRLMDLMPAIKPFGREVHCLVDLDKVRFDNMRNVGIDAIGADIGSINLPETDLIPLVNSFAVHARQRGFVTFMHGISSTSLATAAVCAGYGQLSGAAIYPDLHDVEHAYKFEPINLFGKILSRSR